MSEASTKTMPTRLVSLDAYRGLTMLAMASEGLSIGVVARNFPDSAGWQLAASQISHVAWVGCTAWDLIQPSFMFMVGVSMAFSYASRAARGQAWGTMARHAAIRSLVLVLLGIFLRSRNADATNFTFEDVLTQIGLGYFFLFLLWGRSLKVQALAAALILLGYWAFFYAYPLPGESFDYAAVGVPADWPHLQGAAAHWDKNTNPAAAFDVWFLNLFPRPKPFAFNAGGYLTLSFIPSLATMLFGLMGGELLRGPRLGKSKFLILIAAGVAGLLLGELLHQTGLCPIVKRIWTPSWAIYAGGWTCLILAAFYGVVDLLGYQRWTFPLVVVGMNSIAMYCLAELIPGWLLKTWRTHVSPSVLDVFGSNYEPLLRQSAVLLMLWLICYWMYRQKIFIRV